MNFQLLVFKFTFCRLNVQLYRQFLSEVCDFQYSQHPLKAAEPTAWFGDLNSGDETEEGPLLPGLVLCYQLRGVQGPTFRIDMSLRYQNKVVIVTGGSKGIGRGIVRVFGNYCYLVIIVIYNVDSSATSGIMKLFCFSFFLLCFQWRMEPKWCSVQEEVRELYFELFTDQ